MRTHGRAGVQKQVRDSSLVDRKTFINELFRRPRASTGKRTQDRDRRDGLMTHPWGGQTLEYVRRPRKRKKKPHLPRYRDRERRTIGREQLRKKQAKDSTNRP